MDDETREAISSILGMSSKRMPRHKAPESPFRPSKKPFDFGMEERIAEGVRKETERIERERMEAYERLREAEAEHLAEKLKAHDDIRAESARAAIHKDRNYTTSVRFNCDGINLVSKVSDQIAVLCINTAKACIVLRAPVTLPIIRQFEIWHDEGKAEWNRSDRVMEFHPSILPALKLLLKQEYQDTQLIGVQKQVAATKFDQLMARLDAQDKKSIYNILARRYHPDMSTGNKEIMTLINLVFKS